MGIFMAWPQDERAPRMDCMADRRRENVKRQRIQQRVLLYIYRSGPILKLTRKLYNLL